MKNQLRFLGSVLILLILCLLVVWDNDTGPSHPSEKRFFDFDQSEITSFQVNNFTLGLLFKKTNGAWQVKRVQNKLARELQEKSGSPVSKVDNEFKPADSAQVAKALTYLTSLKGLSPIATQATDPAVYQINEYSLHVILYNDNGEKLAHVQIGKTGPDPFTSFIKKKDQPEVYLAPQDFRYLFLRKYDDWLQKETRFR